MQVMGLTLLLESHGSSLQKTKIANVDQGCPIVNKQTLSFETSLHAVGCSQVVNERIYNGLVEDLVDRSRNETSQSRLSFDICTFP